jgi:hypothetical protein
MASVTLQVKPAVADSLRATLLHGTEPSNHSTRKYLHCQSNW